MREVVNKIIKFRDERDWKQFHNPQNLATSISIEAAELLEHFQWDSEFNVDELSEELADVLIYCILLSDYLNLDIDNIIEKKLIKNAKKYPVSKAKGVSTKYNKL